MNARLFGRTQPRVMRRGAALVGLTALAALLAVLVSMPVAHAQSPGYQQVSAGGYHTCAIQQYFGATGGAIDCWGRNDFGQAIVRTGLFTQVSAGGFHTCALRADGHAECWGSNERSACTDTWCPVYTGQAVAPTNTLFTQISAGAYHSCGLKTDGSVVCWGDNAYGAATNQAGPFTQISAGEDHTCALDLYGRVDCWGDNTKGRGEDRSGPSAQISAGGSHNCAVKQSDGMAECWGSDTYGQSTPPDNAFLQVATGHLHTCGIRSDHTLACWGYNFYGQVKNAPAGYFKQVTSGMGHACAITGANEVYCWGRNDYRQATVPVVGGPGGGLTFDFEGFYPPVEPGPNLNVVKAGQAVPLKFSLGGDRGLNVVAVGYPASRPLACATLNPSGDLQPTRPAGRSGLSYDAKSGQYTYVWKTDKVWAGTCRVLSLQFVDGTEHLAAFQFK